MGQTIYHDEDNMGRSSIDSYFSYEALMQRDLMNIEFRMRAAQNNSGAQMGLVYTEVFGQWP